MNHSDIRGLAQLATQATLGATRITEGVHQSVWSTLSVPGGKAPGRTGGITGLVYKSVHGVTRLVGQGVDLALARLETELKSPGETPPRAPRREALVAALNGVMGDHLVANKNPLVTPMTLRYKQEGASGKVLLLIHGLCMNDLQWRTEHDGQILDHGEALSSALGYTPVYLRYNTGLRIAQNGHQLAAELEHLVAHWPTPIEELTVVAHSMGGLLIRGAVHNAKRLGLAWPEQLNNIIFLGTPHHGAPLERAGHWLDVILGGTTYTAPFAKLSQLRSVGITDLRHGQVLDKDVLDKDGSDEDGLPLPEDVACFAIAAATAAKRGALADHLIGDGLVPLRSALGQHRDARRTLKFAKSSQWIAYGLNHMGLLSSPEVTQQMVQWLALDRANPAGPHGPRGPSRPEPTAPQQHWQLPSGTADDSHDSDPQP